MEKKITIDWATARILVGVLTEARQDAETAEHACDEYTALISNVAASEIIERFEISLCEAFGIEKE